MWQRTFSKFPWTNRFFSLARSKRFSSNGNGNNSSSSLPRLSLFAWYSQKLDTHPLLTKAISSGIIAATGDGMCQVLSSGTTESDKNKIFDWLRNGRFFIMGAFWVAPCTHIWYGLLSTRIFPGPSTLQRVTQRVILDQFGFAVAFQPSFMGLLWLMEGRTNIVEQLKEVVPDVLVANWSLWIPAMAFNFAFFPIKFQVLFGNVVALLWNTYLSYMSALSMKRHTTPVDSNKSSAGQITN